MRRFLFRRRCAPSTLGVGAVGASVSLSSLRLSLTRPVPPFDSPPKKTDTIMLFTDKEMHVLSSAKKS